MNKQNNWLKLNYTSFQNSTRRILAGVIWWGFILIFLWTLFAWNNKFYSYDREIEPFGLIALISMFLNPMNFFVIIF